ncbi:MAG TPA: SagB/ThcOx family dehydrogenase [Candidatus Cloacimonadota bacterium]|nr:SagB/ThcOx family dehydrogenase [Candidatus Cloacimonadota bacterium]
MEKIRENRKFLQSNFLELDDYQTDQNKNLPQPPLQKPVPANAEISDLIAPEQIEVKNNDLKHNILNRRSRRKFSKVPLSLAELSFLLWATQGVKETITRSNRTYVTLRTVPSAGARHPFETYLIVHEVESLKPGLYRYLPLEHKLLFIKEIENQKQNMIEAAHGQEFPGNCAVVFIWAAIPYRTEWRYHTASHKLVLLDAGHVCQNLYLACEGISAGTCAIAAYDQEKTDALIGVDGIDEYSIYMAPVGKLSE